MFHLRDGFYFGRDGDDIIVNVVLEDAPDGGYEHQLRVPVTEWASAVAATTITGENTASYHGALALLGKQPATPA